MILLYLLRFWQLINVLFSKKMFDTRMDNLMFNLNNMLICLSVNAKWSKNVLNINNLRSKQWFDVKVFYIKNNVHLYISVGWFLMYLTVPIEFALLANFQGCNLKGSDDILNNATFKVLTNFSVFSVMCRGKCQMSHNRLFQWSCFCCIKQYY